VISVADTGVGISPQMLPKVFEMFTQVDRSLERSQGGLGIGLSLAKNLVELHGGSISASSDGHGLGSTFVVRLPLLIEQQDFDEPDPVVDRPISARGVLVVDDNHDSANTMAMLLRIGGSETQIASDGKEAVEKAAEFRPDLILLDIGLPKKNGYEACREIRQQPWGKGIVIVALTGWGQEEDRQKSKEAGFNGHLVKPIEHASLVSLLAELEPSFHPAGEPRAMN
jgi:CheY-like chemotaxis protein